MRPRKPYQAVRIGLNADLQDRKFVLACAYVHMIQRAGAVPVIVPPWGSEDLLAAQLASLQGLVLTGTDDYRPSLYGGKPHPAITPVPRSKEKGDLVLCRKALEMRLPVFAICGGMQLLNIACGGTLLPHVEGHGKGHHTVSVARGSRLFRILRKERLRVNTHHHQVVDRLGEGLSAVAFSADDFTEALEGGNSGFVLGVQWHPERMRSESAFALFLSFAREARRLRG